MDAAGNVVNVSYSPPPATAALPVVPPTAIDPDPGGLIAQAERQKQALLDEQARAAKREQARIDRNTYLDAHPPKPDFQDTPGQKAYKFRENFKGADGNWYARYISVAGTKERLYSMSERKWFTEAEKAKPYECKKCQQPVVNGVTGGAENTCPNCGNIERKWY